MEDTGASAAKIRRFLKSAGEIPLLPQTISCATSNRAVLGTKATGYVTSIITTGYAATTPGTAVPAHVTTPRRVCAGRMGDISAWIPGFYPNAWKNPLSTSHCLQLTTTKIYNDYPECHTTGGHPPWVGNGACDSRNNIEACGYDGGDCYICTCVDRESHICGQGVSYTCLDPRVSSSCREQSASIIPGE